MNAYDRKNLPKVIGEFNRVLQYRGVLFCLIRDGYGEEVKECSFPGVKRYFVNYQKDEVVSVLEDSNFKIIDYGYFNEIERYGLSHRDLNMHTFIAQKTN